MRSTVNTACYEVILQMAIGERRILLIFPLQKGKSDASSSIDSDTGQIDTSLW